MILVFTICSNNYLAQAITLGQSLIRNNPDYLFKIGLVDKKNSQIDYGTLNFEVIEVEKIGIGELDKMILRYDIQELNTAVKPFFFKYFFNSGDSFDKIIYLDPDILVYSSFSELEKELDKYDILVTPHISGPINDDRLPSENSFLNAGLYNLGFIAIKKAPNSQNMVDWWSQRLTNKGFNDVKNGMFTDQIWINFVPIFFEKVSIFTHSGYNMAYWNLHERVLSVNSTNIIVNNNYPLVFFHFSGYSPHKPEAISKYQDRFTFDERQDIQPLFTEYCNLLDHNRHKFFQRFTCTYSDVKQRNDDKLFKEKIQHIPKYKILISRIINRIVKKFNIILDYRIFYDR
jgi:lipopolysaccharide biosynthesis glycosyltransferase